MLPIGLVTSRCAPAKATGAGRALFLAVCLTVAAGGCSDAVRPSEHRGEPDRALPEQTRDGTADLAGCRVPERASPPSSTPHYRMDLTIAPDAGTVDGRSRVRFEAERRTARLVFRLWPNGPRLAAAGAGLRVLEARLHRSHQKVERPDPTTLLFDLREPLDAGDSVVAVLDWRLRLPGAVLDRISQNGDAVRLGSFFPILAWEGERGWATDPPTTTLAESSTTPTADFDVRVEVPEGLQVIATGEEIRPGRWRARAVRDFAVAAGRFDVAERTVRAPGPVRVTIGVAEGLEAVPAEFAAAVARALRDLSARYGAYPWKTFSMAVMPDLGRSGIEYPTMIFQGEDSLATATTHEVAHSWFYALVGNNQARDPWLDEGVTSWAQARGDGILEYFRGFEVPSAVGGRLGEPMTYWDDHERDYYAGVYAQGVRALDALGDAAKVDCALARYVARHAYSVAAPDALVDALGSSFPRARVVLRRFGVSGQSARMRR